MLDNQSASSPILGRPLVLLPCFVLIRYPPISRRGEPSILRGNHPTPSLFGHAIRTLGPTWCITNGFRNPFIDFHV